jgi:hypothetical protein
MTEEQIKAREVAAYEKGSLDTHEAIVNSIREIARELRNKGLEGVDEIYDQIADFVESSFGKDADN